MVSLPLPLLLAGPILRRVEPNLVSVWVALSREASVVVTLWQGRAKAGFVDHLIRSEPASRTLRCGEQLHVAVALLRIPAESEKTLKPGLVYSYDLAITQLDGSSHTLESLGLLKTAPSANGGSSELARPHLALGYVDDFLPSFALPPDSLQELRIVYGSCRRPANEHPDAMPWIDELIETGKLYEQPLQRPHQLMLGGDQIYADDVWFLHLHLINRLANELIGTVADPDQLHGPDGKPAEQVIVDQVERRLGADEEDPVTFPDRYKPQPGSAALPVGLAEFPAGRRRPLVLRSAQMTTVDGDSHLISFGEFAAMYLMVWCNACWPLQGQWPSLQAAVGHMDTPPLRPHLGLFRMPPEDLEGLSEIDKLKRQDRHDKVVARLADFVAGLPRVRRLLANVPTYMVFDDHDVTDDWNLNPTWYDRVYTTSLGRAIVRNALASYAVFQDWGNDPLRYENERDEPGEKRDRKRLLDAIARMFPQGAESGPSSEVVNTLDDLLGLNLRPQPNVDGGYDAVEPKIKWHFSVGGPKHLMVALDNRTRRSFVSRNGPPGNVAVAAQAEQIPATLPDGCEVLFVVAPLQVLGPAILDELIAPATFRIFDAIGYKELNDLDEEALAKALGLGSAEDLRQLTPNQLDELKRKHPTGTRRMAGTNPDAIEAWAFDAQAFEALLARLAAHRRVVLLSGDVHYTAANAMSYWTKGNETPARIVQFTGSGFKNVMPWYIGTVDRVLSFAQRMIRAEIGAERMGWNKSTKDAFALPGGSDLGDVPPALRKKLAGAPMLMPTFGWPAGTTVAADKLPDWSWRMVPVLDTRADDERPPPARPRALEPDALRVESVLALHADPGAELSAYQTVAARHQDQFDRLRHARQILFRSNFALVRCERSGDETFAVHEVYTALRDPDEAADVEPSPLAYMVQRASLDPPADEIRPELAPMRPPVW